MVLLTLKFCSKIDFVCTLVGVQLPPSHPCVRKGDQLTNYLAVFSLQDPNLRISFHSKKINSKCQII